MTDRLGRSVLYTYGVADLFFVLLVNMEMVFFPAFLTDYAQVPQMQDEIAARRVEEPNDVARGAFAVQSGE